MSRLIVAIRTLLLALLSITFSNVQAAWPEKPITIIVPFTPGGATDILGRLTAQHLTEVLKQPVVVVNKPGAGSMLGSKLAADSKADGYTLLVGSIANVLNEFFYKKPLLTFATELDPVAQLVSVPNFFALNKNFKGNTLADVISWAKDHPNELSCASSSIGTSPYMSCIMLGQKAGIKLTVVPYKGGAPAIQDTIAGVTQVVASNEVLPVITDGRLIGLAATTPQRSPFAPNIPAAAEIIPGFDVTSWYGVFAPAGTPREIVNRLNQEVNKMLLLPEIKNRLDTLGATAAIKTPTEFRNYIKDELNRWEPIVKSLNHTLD